MIDVKKCWAALHSHIHCNENTCDSCKIKYLNREYLDEIACPIDVYKDEIVLLTQIFENLMETKNQITEEEFVKLLFEGEPNV